MRTFALQRGIGNRGRGVRVQHLVGQPLRFGAAAGVAQKVEYVDQAGPGKNALIADVSKAGVRDSGTARPPIVARCKVGVAAFGGEDVMPVAVPVHAGFAESGAGGDHRLIADGISLHLVQRDHVFGIKRGDAPGVGFEIIDQEGVS